jgi:predicted alpha/beta hydrolase family esterase
MSSSLAKSDASDNKDSSTAAAKGNGNSPPPTIPAVLPEALAVTPAAYRESLDAITHIPFLGSNNSAVVLYAGAFVDARAYSVMAERLSREFGYTTLIPVYANLMSFEFDKPPPPPSRLEELQRKYPHIQNWILVGHSMGGIAAAHDMHQSLSTATPASALVFLASYMYSLNNTIDFSTHPNILMASVTATNDAILNHERFQQAQKYLPPNTMQVEIQGGNHAAFGHYQPEDADRTIDHHEQQDRVIQVILEITRRIASGDASEDTASVANSTANE